MNICFTSPCPLCLLFMSILLYCFIFLGWHNRINTAARHGSVSLYVLVPALKTEADVVEVRVRADDLERDVLRIYGILEQRLQTYWTQYMDNQITTTHFLKAVSRLYRPSNNPLDHVEPAPEPAADQ